MAVIGLFAAEVETPYTPRRFSEKRTRSGISDDFLACGDGLAAVLIPHCPVARQKAHRTHQKRFDMRQDHQDNQDVRYGRSWGAPWVGTDHSLIAP